MIAAPEHWHEWDDYAVFEEDDCGRRCFVRFKDNAPDYIREEITRYRENQRHMQDLMRGRY